MIMFVVVEVAVLVGPQVLEAEDVLAVHADVLAAVDVGGADDEDVAALGLEYGRIEAAAVRDLPVGRGMEGAGALAVACPDRRLVVNVVPPEENGGVTTVEFFERRSETS
jgi:hypothetical protein